MVFSLGSIAQSNQMPVTFFDYGKKLPEKILSNNSAVFIAQIDDSGASLVMDEESKIEHPKVLTSEVHSMLTDAGVNPMVYVHASSFAGNDMVKSIYNELIEKEIETIITFSYSAMVIEGEIKYTYMITAADFNKKESFFDNNQYCFRMYDPTFEKLSKNFLKKAAKSKVNKEEMPLQLSPTILNESDLVQGKKHHSLPLNYKDASFITCKYERCELPSEKPSGLLQRVIYAQLESNNEQVPANNQKLEEIFKSSGINYEFKPYSEVHKPCDNCYVIYSLIVVDREDRNTFLWNNVDEIHNSDSEIFETKRETSFYTYYYLKNPNNGDTYYVDYGDYKDSNESLKAFLEEIQNQG